MGFTEFIDGEYVAPQILGRKLLWEGNSSKCLLLEEEKVWEHILSFLSWFLHFSLLPAVPRNLCKYFPNFRR